MTTNITHFSQPNAVDYSGIEAESINSCDCEYRSHSRLEMYSDVFVTTAHVLVDNYETC